MIWSILCDNHLIAAHGGEGAGFAVLSASMETAMDAAGALTFTVGEEHPNFAKLVTRRSVVKVLDAAGLTCFRGRIIRQTRLVDRTRVFECEGMAACLNDTLMPPYNVPGDYTGDAEYLAAVVAGTVPKWWLGKLIDQHNATCGKTANRVVLGDVTVEAMSVAVSSDDWQTVWDAASALRDAAGGHLCVRYAADATYIDYLAEITGENGQAVVGGVNLIDLTVEDEGEEYCNAVIPIGAGGMTCAAAADGYRGGNYYKTGSRVETPTQRASYGNVMRAVSWEDATTAEGLVTRAVAYLDAHAWGAPGTVSVQAVDRSELDAGYERFQSAKTLRIRSAVHNIDMTLPLARVVRDLVTGEVDLTLINDAGEDYGDDAGAAILWENDDPAAAFAAQTVEIDGLSAYDLITIEVAWSTGYPLRRASTTIGYEAGAQAHPAVVWYGSNVIRAVYRIVTLEANAVTFGTGRWVSNSAAVDGEAYAIPLRVTGYKYT